MSNNDTNNRQENAIKKKKNSIQHCTISISIEKDTLDLF